MESVKGDTSELEHEMETRTADVLLTGTERTEKTHPKSLVSALGGMRSRSRLPVAGQTVQTRTAAKRSSHQALSHLAASGDGRYQDDLARSTEESGLSTTPRMTAIVASKRRRIDHSLPNERVTTTELRGDRNKDTEEATDPSRRIEDKANNALFIGDRASAMKGLPEGEDNKEQSVTETMNESLLNSSGKTRFAFLGMDHNNDAVQREAYEASRRAVENGDANEATLHAARDKYRLATASKEQEIADERVKSMLNASLFTSIGAKRPGAPQAPFGATDGLYRRQNTHEFRSLQRESGISQYGRDPESAAEFGAGNGDVASVEAALHQKEDRLDGNHALESPGDPAHARPYLHRLRSPSGIEASGISLETETGLYPHILSSSLLGRAGAPGTDSETARQLRPSHGSVLGELSRYLPTATGGVPAAALYRHAYHPLASEAHGIGIASAASIDAGGAYPFGLPQTLLGSGAGDHAYLLTSLPPLYATSRGVLPTHGGLASGVSDAAGRLTLLPAAVSHTNALRMHPAGATMQGTLSLYRGSLCTVCAEQEKAWFLDLRMLCMLLISVIVNTTDPSYCIAEMLLAGGSAAASRIALDGPQEHQPMRSSAAGGHIGDGVDHRVRQVIAVDPVQTPQLYVGGHSVLGHRQPSGAGQIVPTKLSTSREARDRTELDGGQLKSTRDTIPLETDEDENWLSEFLCFVRAELVEVFRANKEDVASRINSKKVIFGQVGIRCRYCASFPHCDRASRSSCFPSSISRIYQSLTMMIRDHFTNCNGLPLQLRTRFLQLKGKTAQGATDSKRYWIDSALKLGMVDTPQGIILQEDARQKYLADERADRATEGGQPTEEPVFLVLEQDKHSISEYLFVLMSQVQVVYLTDKERVGNRKNMDLDTPGFGCRYCCSRGRKGLCRFFPARRRTLPNKVKDLHDHLRRCRLCPSDVKQQLRELYRQNSHSRRHEECEKAFFDRVWSRLHASSAQQEV